MKDKKIKRAADGAVVDCARGGPGTWCWNGDTLNVCLPSGRFNTVKRLLPYGHDENDWSKHGPFCLLWNRNREAPTLFKSIKTISWHGYMVGGVLYDQSELPDGVPDGSE